MPFFFQFLNVISINNIKNCLPLFFATKTLKKSFHLFQQPVDSRVFQSDTKQLYWKKNVRSQLFKKLKKQPVLSRCVKAISDLKKSENSFSKKILLALKAASARSWSQPLKWHVCLNKGGGFRVIFAPVGRKEYCGLRIAAAWQLLSPRRSHRLERQPAIPPRGEPLNLPLLYSDYRWLRACEPTGLRLVRTSALISDPLTYRLRALSGCIHPYWDVWAEFGKPGFWLHC